MNLTKVIMANNNAQKRKEIDGILTKYNARMIILKQRRNKIILNFLETLKEKKIKELRNSLK